jgi:hypothetical protein
MIITDADGIGTELGLWATLTRASSSFLSRRADYCPPESSSLAAHKGSIFQT